MHESYRTFLRLFSMRTEVPTWVSVLVLGSAAAMVLYLVAHYLLERARQRRALWDEFFRAARVRGLSSDQSRFLAGLGDSRRMKRPTSMLMSRVVFDQIVGNHAARLVAERLPGQNRKLMEISRIRAKLGFDHLRDGQMLESTRQIEPGWTVSIRRPGGDGGAVIHCVVAARDEGGIDIVALLDEDEPRLARIGVGDTADVHLMRQADTEYSFLTRVIGADRDSGRVVIAHADAVNRNQRRQFFRIETEFELALFPGVVLNGVEGEAVFADTSRGPAVVGQVVNLSAGGLAIQTGEPKTLETRMVVDPDFDGAFRVAGIPCHIVSVRQEAHGWLIRLRFIDLDPQRQDLIVRDIYKYQVQSGAVV
ncbi:MAG: PilZ domain-containing protein [Candidatus Schekmanbacteria bacterium]|nr:PilZ domain-containing protein [Candidatus Schekmanbacteria bacterium]